MSNEKMETKKSDKFLSTLEAAQKGDADAQFALGVMYKHGIGVAQDYEQALNIISWLLSREILMHKSN